MGCVCTLPTQHGNYSTYIHTPSHTPWMPCPVALQFSRGTACAAWGGAAGVVEQLPWYHPGCKTGLLCRILLLTNVCVPYSNAHVLYACCSRHTPFAPWLMRLVQQSASMIRLVHRLGTARLHSGRPCQSPTLYPQTPVVHGSRVISDAHTEWVQRINIGCLVRITSFSVVVSLTCALSCMVRT